MKQVKEIPSNLPNGFRVCPIKAHETRNVWILPHVRILIQEIVIFIRLWSTVHRHATPPLAAYGSDDE